MARLSDLAEIIIIIIIIIIQSDNVVLDSITFHPCTHSIAILTQDDEMTMIII